jgi:structural maintenance of chromosome 2
VQSGGGGKKGEKLLARMVKLRYIRVMLLFKPAPLYILDEVDAALALSHTQNIGHMLRTHFNKSQFVVTGVSE